MCCLWIMFVTAVCFSFLLKLNKNIYHRIFSKFPISTNFSDRLRKTIYPPDYTQELTKHLQKSPNVDREIFDFLKPERDICTKNTIPNQITSFMLTPPQAIYIYGDQSGRGSSFIWHVTFYNRNQTRFQGFSVTEIESRWERGLTEVTSLLFIDLFHCSFQFYLECTLVWVIRYNSITLMTTKNIPQLQLRGRGVLNVTFKKFKKTVDFPTWWVHIC